MVPWKWPASHGEQAYIVMLGGLHIEMALWSVLGDLLDGSGWTTALIEAEVASVDRPNHEMGLSAQKAFKKHVHRSIFQAGIWTTSGQSSRLFHLPSNSCGSNTMVHGFQSG